MGTTSIGLPYPESTDYVTDGAFAIEALATAVNDALLTSFFSPVLINGGMEIWQRGTAAANATTTYNTNTSYRADRWYTLPAGATVTQEQSTSVPPNNLSRFSLRVNGATSATTVKIGQRIEAANIPQIRRRVTFAAWLYNETGASFTPELLLGTPSASDNFATVNNRLTQTLIPCANAEWTEISFSADISGYTDLANGLQVEILIPSGSMNATSKKVYVTQVRLTPTADVVPFQPLAINDELSRCYRYYETGVTPPHLFTCALNQQDSVNVSWHTRKRVTPNNSGISNISSNIGTNTGVSVTNSAIFVRFTAAVAGVANVSFTYFGESEL
jgi:hypothetical protein